jgi:hypothetical protein
VLAGVAGLEHGVGEVLQGNVAPPGLIFESWAGSELFRILSGEPALTIIPNLLVSGILTILLSLIFLTWALLFVERKHGGLVLIGLSFVLLFVGGGFGPPLLGIIVGLTATRIHAPLRWWRARLGTRSRGFLAWLWLWSFGGALVAWLYLFPGSILLGAFAGVSDEGLAISVAIAILAAFTLLLLTIVSGFAYDIQQQDGVHWRPAISS